MKWNEYSPAPLRMIQTMMYRRITLNVNLDLFIISLTNSSISFDNKILNGKTNRHYLISKYSKFFFLTCFSLT